ncbi:rhamnosyl/mannosyltransferase [Salinimicrobium catena]|uniref:Rhamnosyl/mannosyltransferase n=1 Tax=Salinimicrobium catena TaxID=390640 RepID=A0A1H5PED4_9FLAO|nr:glycosyltransferase [Salinimicrobium catena]SDL80753.1 rhamnosyl/mannosyltransferase [Salinimicrobium catena]SEF12050.1 rhamnosyl/mannosyltransferase [Salinimicrobium catena]
MKILHIGKFYPPFLGGIETVNYDLVEGLHKQNIKTDVLVVNHRKEKFSSDSSKTYLFRAQKNITISSQPISISYLKKIFQCADNYDIVHLHLPNPLATLPFILISKRKFKLVLHWHSDIVKQKVLKFFYKPIQNMVLKKADSIVTTSANYGKESIDLQKFQSKIKNIPIGITPAENKYKSNTLTKIIAGKSNKKIIFALGRLVYYKGFSYLLEAAQQINDEAIIIIGGTGPLRQNLQRFIDTHHLQEKVFLVGRISDEELPDYFTQCDIFCFPSTEKSEAFGVSQIEAMAYGKPVVSTNIKGSGVPWVNQNGISGLVVPPKNPIALATAINLLTNNKKLYADLSIGAKNRYEKLFTKEKMVSSFIELYKNLKNDNK